MFTQQVWDHDTKAFKYISDVHEFIAWHREQERKAEIARIAKMELIKNYRKEMGLS